MATKIVFSDGASVTVTAEVKEVKEILTRDKHGVGEPFTRFEAQGGRDVYVSAERVAYFQEISGDMHVY